MHLPDVQVATVLAVVDHGTFEAAARALHVTPSAVSQRVRALESAAGQVLVRRGTPCVPTPAGEAVVRLGRAQAALREEALAALEPGAGHRLDLRVAVNADSLATWVRDVLAEAATWDDVALGLEVEDQAFSHDLLRRGDALAAVTSDPRPVQGCSAERLGTLRYHPAAAPALLDRCRSEEGPDWSRLPMVVFNAKDRLQHDLLAARGRPEPPAVHRVPTSQDFLAAVVAGLGWGMVPEPQLDPLERAGDLVRIDPGHHVDTVLHWQRWRLDSDVLGRVTAAVRSAAARHLRP